MSPESNIHTSPKEIVEAAITAGLDGIAITDHNSAVWIDRIQDAIRGTPVVLFPGIEVSAKGGHVLAIFEPLTPSTELNQVIKDTGFLPNHYGLGYLEGNVWMDEVFDIIARHGGLAVSAHVDRRPRGFIAASEIPTDVKKRIFYNSNLQAMEITIPQNKPLWNNGQMPGFQTGKACIQGSDAHAPAEMGRRPIFVDLPQVNLGGLRMAFQEYKSRIRFPHEIETELASKALP